jgi:hypothetical protein
MNHGRYVLKGHAEENPAEDTPSAWGLGPRHLPCQGLSFPICKVGLPVLVLLLSRRDAADGLLPRSTAGLKSGPILRVANGHRASG